MADYVTLFSTAIPYANESQRDWLLKTLAADEICEYEDQPAERHIWVYAENHGDPDVLADLIATFQREFQLTTPWILTWAHSCNRPVLDSFSGGALCVYRGTIHHCIPELLIQEHLKSQGWEAPKPPTQAENTA